MIILKCDIFPYQLNNKLLQANKEGIFNRCISFEEEQARKPRSYASSKLRPTDSLTDSGEV